MSSTVVTPSDGDSITVPSLGAIGTYVISLTTNFNALDVTMTASPSDGDILTICCPNYLISNFTLHSNTGQTNPALDGITWPFGGSYIFQWISSLSMWVCLGKF